MKVLSIFHEKDGAEMWNSLKYTKQLEEVGLTRIQAETHIQIMGEIVDTNLASKQDMKDLRQDMRQDMKDLTQELQQEMKDLKVELRQEMKDLGQELRHEMRLLEQRMTIKLGAIVSVAMTVVVAVAKLVS